MSLRDAHRSPTPYPAKRSAFCAGITAVIGAAPRHRARAPPSASTTRSAALALPSTPGAKRVACMRVRVVSTGWTARTDAAPAIQPAQRSTQNSFVIARAVREAGGTRGGGRGNQSIDAVDPDAGATRVPVE